MSKNYTKEIRKKLTYSATWLPNAKVRLGDVVLLSGNTYRRKYGPEKLGIKFETRESDGEALLEHISAKGVKINFAGSGSSPKALKDSVDARAGIDVKFTTANAVLFQTGPCKILEIEDLGSVEDRVMELYQQKKWKEDYVLVTEVVLSERTTVLISSASNARAVITAKAGTSFGKGSFIDANAGLKLDIGRTKNIGTRIVSESDMTPLFRGFGVRKHILRDADFGPVRVETPPTFTEVDYQDFA